MPETFVLSDRCSRCLDETDDLLRCHLCQARVCPRCVAPAGSNSSCLPCSRAREATMGPLEENDADLSQRSGQRRDRRDGMGQSQLPA
eukprot:10925009-Lingulodinium_polyedra.AAC.1